MQQDVIDVDCVEIVCLGIALDARDQDRGASKGFVECEGWETAKGEVTRRSRDISQNRETE